MDLVIKLLSISGAVFLTATLLWNINPRWPRIPMEPFLSKFGLQIYIPLWTSLVISIVLIVMMNFFKVQTPGV